ncbi:MAG: MCE family protein [Desulfuromonas sp.]|nr:MAG: MCE family protein [Desulfuromonas sp.]
MYSESDSRFKGLEFKVGLFIVVSLLGLVAVLAFLAIENDLFASRYLLQFTVEKGTGFNQGMPVKLSGFRIGRLGEIRLNDQARVDILMDIDSEYARWIREDSVARLVNEGLVGDSIIEIDAGSSSSPELKDGETIRFEHTKTLEEHVNDIATKVQPVLLEVRDIIGYVADPEGDFKQSLRNINQLTHELQGTRGRVDSLLDATSTDISSLLKQANQTFSSLDSILGQAEDDIPQILQRVDATLENLQTITTDVRVAAGQVMPRVPGIVDSADQVIEEAGELVESANNMWLFSKDEPQPVPTVLPSDSHE